MSKSWNDGYFSEQAYISEYYRELAPNWLQFSLWLNDFCAPKISSYCELGFGNGISINVHAATNSGEFFGTDFNPAHAAFASELAQSSKARLFDDSFQDFEGRVTRDKESSAQAASGFDAIALHGIYSWINRANRMHLVDFAAKQLKPGGVMYISYNALPGWTPSIPLRDLFYNHHKLGSKPGMGEAFAFAQRLLELNPRAVIDNPSIKSALEAVLGHDEAYLAHEYLSDTFRAFNLSEVATDFAKAKMSFASSANSMEFITSKDYDEEDLEFLRELKDVLLKEQAKDWLINKKFRKDIFVKGARRLEAAQSLFAFKNMHFMLTKPASKAPERVEGRKRVLAFKEEAYKPLLELLESDNYRAKSGEEIIDAYGDEFSMYMLKQVLAILTSQGIISPAFSQQEADKNAAKSLALNKQLLEISLDSSKLKALASPVTGSAIILNRFMNMFCYYAQQGFSEANDLVRLSAARLEANGECVVKEGERIEEPLAIREFLQGEAKEFLKLLPILRALRILD